MFLNYLNTKYRNIEFTVEYEIDNSLPFFDVKVTKLDNKLETHVFGKDIFAVLGLNFFLVPHLWKANCIHPLVYRVYNTCSS